MIAFMQPASSCKIGCCQLCTFQRIAAVRGFLRNKSCSCIIFQPLDSLECCDLWCRHHSSPNAPETVISSLLNFLRRAVVYWSHSTFVRTGCLASYITSRMAMMPTLTTTGEPWQGWLTAPWGLRRTSHLGQATLETITENDQLLLCSCIFCSAKLCQPVC